ncbi:hypothetical protein [Bacillus sp. T33-2]|uniref:hypothetical protein n=1 Tax=Bacillus sp. T33-2 TaxID=2054168 RepID=UPI00115B819B|nr:hypothetical protein [Bacillus sp. T33-2]
MSTSLGCVSNLSVTSVDCENPVETCPQVLIQASGWNQLFAFWSSIGIVILAGRILLVLTIYWTPPYN